MSPCQVRQSASKRRRRRRRRNSAEGEGGTARIEEKSKTRDGRDPTVQLGGKPVCSVCRKAVRWRGIRTQYAVQGIPRWWYRGEGGGRGGGGGKEGLSDNLLTDLQR